MKKRLRWILRFCVGVLVLLAFSNVYAESPPVFTDVTSESGIDFRHSFGDENMSSILEATGSGCAFFDYDGDGDIDLYVVNGCYLEGVSDSDSPCKGVRLTNHLYSNDGKGKFIDMTDESGIGDAGYGMGCVIGDYDNDGDSDLYVTNYGQNRLYQNNGDGTFTDVTERAGVGNNLWGVGATFLDYDNDGDLDLYVGNYLEFDPEYRLYYKADIFPGPLAYPGQPDVLYRNNGDGTFSDFTEKAGITNEGRAMGVISSDYDNDGLVDIFVANDAMENYLYHNKGDGTFTDVGLESGTAFSEHGDATASMGGDFGDFDGDGDLDLLVPDMTFNGLYKNLRKGLFEDVSVVVGLAVLSGQYWSWGGDFLDYDNDGDLDIFISNGSGHRLEGTQEELLVMNTASSNGGRVVQDIAGKSGQYFHKKSVSRGMAVGDYDNDGDLDVFIVNLDQPSTLLRNDGGNRNNWLMFYLIGTRSNRDGLGGRVIVRTKKISQVEEKKSATSYISQNDPRLHFGIGKRTQVDEVIIKWPSGITQRLKNVKANQVVIVKEAVK